MGKNRRLIHVTLGFLKIDRGHGTDPPPPPHPRQRPLDTHARRNIDFCTCVAGKYWYLNVLGPGDMIKRFLLKDHTALLPKLLWGLPFSTQFYMLSGPTHSLFACYTQWKCIGGLTPPHPNPLSPRCVRTKWKAPMRKEQHLDS